MRIAVVDPEKRINGLVRYKARKALEKYGGGEEPDLVSYKSRRSCLRRYRTEGPFDEMFAVHATSNMLDMGTDEMILGIRDIEARKGDWKACNIHRVYPGGVSESAEFSYYRNAGGKAFNGDPSLMAVELGKYFEGLLA
jgi:hypothetical protein